MQNRSSNIRPITLLHCSKPTPLLKSVTTLDLLFVVIVFWFSNTTIPLFSTLLHTQAHPRTHNQITAPTAELTLRSKPKEPKLAHTNPCSSQFEIASRVGLQNEPFESALSILLNTLMGGGHVFPFVKWLFDLYCACVLREQRGSREPAKLALRNWYIPARTIWIHTLHMDNKHRAALQEKQTSRVG